MEVRQYYGLRFQRIFNHRGRYRLQLTEDSIMGNMMVFMGFLFFISAMGLAAAYLSTRWDD